MHVHIVLFAALREALGARRLTVDLPPGSTGAQLRARLARDHPRWRDLLGACRLARGVEFIDDSEELSEGVEIALIPPVSGGCAPPDVLLTADPLDGNRLKEAASRAGAGAVALFEGTVRTPSRGRDVRHLEYEAHEPMARAQMERILAEARARWPVTALFLHHRLGVLPVGEVSVVAVASAPHRAEAFEACRHLIERLKHEVPIWKKEVFADGSEWVGAPGECAHDG
jgi:molybdopterin synthase catalytic subunit